MSTTDIKEVVKEKYGQAALRVKAGGSSCCGATASSGCCDPITSRYYTTRRKQSRFPKRQCLPLSAAESDCFSEAESG